jgi:hypothetical protein
MRRVLLGLVALLTLPGATAFGQCYSGGYYVGPPTYYYPSYSYPVRIIYSDECHTTPPTTYQRTTTAPSSSYQVKATQISTSIPKRAPMVTESVSRDDDWRPAKTIPKLESPTPDGTAVPYKSNGSSSEQIDAILRELQEIRRDLQKMQDRLKAVEDSKGK